MHELSLCRAIAETVGRHADGRRVETVRLRIGHFRQVVPDTMAYCWELQVHDTELAGSQLLVEHVPAVVRCRDCAAETVLDLPVRQCGACGSLATDLVSGDEFLIESIDVITPDPVDHHVRRRDLAQSRGEEY